MIIPPCHVELVETSAFRWMLYNIIREGETYQHNFFRWCVEYAAKMYDSGSERSDDWRYDIPPVGRVNEQVQHETKL